jgi:hypothetical protein
MRRLLFLLLKENLAGKMFWNIPYSSGNISLENGSIKYSKKLYGGIICRVGYEVDLSRYYYLIPQYLFYVGISPEFDNEANTKSIRQFVEIGIGKRLRE